jgi:hypothetical protein
VFSECHQLSCLNATQVRPQMSLGGLCLLSCSENPMEILEDGFLLNLSYFRVLGS